MHSGGCGRHFCFEGGRYEMRRSTPAWAAGKVRATILTQSAPCPRCPRSQPGLASPSPLSKLNCSCLALSRDSLWPEVNRRPHSRCGWSIRPGWAVGAGADTRTSWPGARGTCLRNPRAVTGKRKRLRGPMFSSFPVALVRGFGGGDNVCVVWLRSRRLLAAVCSNRRARSAG